MKAIIYTGISLFCAASVYGVIDYYGEKKKGTMSVLYADEAPEAAPAKPAAATAAVTGSSTEVKSAAPAAKTAVKTKKRRKDEKVFVKHELFSRNALVREVPIVLDPEAVPAAAPVTVVAATPAAASTETVATEKPVPAVAAVTAPPEKPAVAETKPAMKEIKEEDRVLRMEMFSRAPLKKRIKKAKPAETPVTKTAEQ